MTSVSTLTSTKPESAEVEARDDPEKEEKEKKEGDQFGFLLGGLPGAASP